MHRQPLKSLKIPENNYQVVSKQGLDCMDKRAAVPQIDVLVFGQPNSGKDAFVEQYTSNSANQAPNRTSRKFFYPSKSVTLPDKKRTEVKL